MKRIFQNPVHQQNYEQDGYVVVDFFSPEAVERLSKDYEGLTPESKSGFHSTVHNSSVTYRQAVNDTIKQYVEPQIREIFIDYKFIGGTFVVKEPDAQSGVQLHQDYLTTDESQYPSLVIWVSLVDTNYKNGALYFLKGSHNLPRSLRGAGLPDPCQYCQTIALDQMSYTPTRAGQAVIFNASIIHASRPNRSEKRRIACYIGTIDRSANLLHYHYDAATQLLSTYALEPDFFVKNQYGSDTQVSVSLQKQSTVLESEFKQYTFDDLKPLLPKPKGWKKWISYFS